MMSFAACKLGEDQEARLESFKTEPYLSQQKCVQTSKMWMQAPAVVVDPGLLQVEIQAEQLPGFWHKKASLGVKSLSQ